MISFEGGAPAAGGNRVALALRPVARSGVDNRGRPWTAGTAFGCTLAAHRLNPVPHPSTTWGGTPPQTPPRLRGPAGPFEKLNPGGEKGLGVGHGQACGLPTPATVAPVPGTPSC